MDSQSLINIGLSTVAAIGGWFAREMWTAVKELKVGLAKLREELPQTYVPKDDFREGIREIKEMLTRLLDKLDHKADKP